MSLAMTAKKTANWNSFHMAIGDLIRAAESGGDPNLRAPIHMGVKLGADARVGELLFPGRPAAIARFVIAIAVNAINGMIFARAWPHVGVKCLKALSPAGTNTNSSLSVEPVRNVRLVFATLDHAPPNPIFEGRFGEAMRAVCLRNGLSPVATATQRVSRFKVRHRYCAFIPAIAAAEHLPDGGSSIFADFGRRVCEGNEPLVPISDVIFAGAH